MLKNTTIFVIILTLTLVLTGCASSDTVETPSEDKQHNQTQQQQQDKQQNQTQQQQDKQQNKEQTNQDDEFSLEEKLVPPKFIIKKFTAKYDKAEKEIIYKMDYEIDIDIYDSLTKGNQEMHFSLEYPESVQKYYNSYYSPSIKAEQAKDHKINYHAVFKQKAIKELSDKEINEIINNLERYNLHIADKDKEVISMFDDIIGFMDYQPGVSKSEYIDQTQN